MEIIVPILKTETELSRWHMTGTPVFRRLRNEDWRVQAHPRLYIHSKSLSHEIKERQTQLQRGTFICPKLKVSRTIKCFPQVSAKSVSR